MRIVRHINKETGEKTRNIVFVECPVSFPHLIEPTMNTADSDPNRHFMEYSADILFSKDIDRSALDELIQECIDEKWPKGAPKFRNEFIKDGDQKRNSDGEPYEEYANMWYITTRQRVDSGRKPQVVDRAKNELTSPDGIVGGDICTSLVNIYAYNKTVNKGISSSPHTVILVEKTENPFGGGMSRSAGLNALDEFVTDDDMI